MKARVQQKKWISVRKDVVLRLQKCVKENLCCACLEPLGDKKPIRGCHPACAKATYRAIEKGAFTDEQRVADGKWLQAASAGRKPSNPVSVEAQS